MLVLIDYYSKWSEAATCEHVTSGSVIAFLTQIFDRFGVVEEIVTDNGPQFVSIEFETFLASLGIRHSRSALYNPQDQAEVESFNRVMKDGLKTGLADGKDFQTAIRQTLATYRNFTSLHNWCYSRVADVSVSSSNTVNVAAAVGGSSAYVIKVSSRSSSFDMVKNIISTHPVYSVCDCDTSSLQATDGSRLPRPEIS